MIGEWIRDAMYGALWALPAIVMIEGIWCGLKQHWEKQEKEKRLKYEMEHPEYVKRQYDEWRNRVGV